MTSFENHAPINFDGTEEVARHDSGQDFGHHIVYVRRGGMYHMYESYNSGNTIGGEPKTRRTYLFGCRTTEELIQWLLTEKQRQIQDPDNMDTLIGVDDLLQKLGYLGEPA